MLARADLHVHTWHSGYNHDLPFLRSRDCFADPLAVYRTAKARGMDLVAITDHDSIDGGLELLSRLPDGRDFILGEEVSCWLPVPGATGDAARVEVHFGAWGMTETAHRELQPLRGNAFEVAAYLRAAGIFFAFNHPFHFYRGQLPLERYLELVDAGARHRDAQRRDAAGAQPARRGARRGPAARSSVGGSDAHTLRRVGHDLDGGARRRRARSSWPTSPPGAAASAASTAARCSSPRDIYGVIAQYLAEPGRPAAPRDQRAAARSSALASRWSRCPASSCRWSSRRDRSSAKRAGSASSAAALGVALGRRVPAPVEIEPEPGPVSRAAPAAASPSPASASCRRSAPAAKPTGSTWSPASAACGR